MTKCYYCGKTDGSHDISCICGKSPAMNAASPSIESEQFWYELSMVRLQKGEFQQNKRATEHLIPFINAWGASLATPVGQGSAPQPCSAFECKAGQQDGVLCADDGCDIANGVRSQGSATTGEEFHKHLDKCSAEVATWPAWKQRGGFGQGRATSDEAAFKKAVDAVYPIPDSPHTSVLQRAVDNRIAFRLGYAAAKAEQSNSAGSARSQIMEAAAAILHLPIEDDAEHEAVLVQIRKISAALAAPVAERAAAPEVAPAASDGCKFCLGAKGGVPGNANVIGGKVVCDYCTSLLLTIRDAERANPTGSLFATPAPASVPKPAAPEVAEQALQALRHMQGLAALPDGRNPRDVLLAYIQLSSAAAPEVAQPAAQGEPVAVFELESCGWEFVGDIDPDWLMSLPVGTKLHYLATPAKNEP